MFKLNALPICEYCGYEIKPGTRVRVHTHQEGVSHFHNDDIDCSALYDQAVDVLIEMQENS